MENGFIYALQMKRDFSGMCCSRGDVNLTDSNKGGMNLLDTEASQKMINCYLNFFKSGVMLNQDTGSQLFHQPPIMFKFM